MMKRLVALLLMTLLLCASCTALPEEERAFAVALCIEKKDDLWRVYGRIPTYQSSGGYTTVDGEGSTLTEALTALSANAPMQLHLSQLRLLVLQENLAQSGELSVALETLSSQQDMHLQCSVALTDAPLKQVAEALKPSTGARLSKSIDVLLESRQEQGVVLPAKLGDVLRMGSRQSPVLMALTLEEGVVNLSGGYGLTEAFHLAARLSPEECKLLSLLLGQTREVQLATPSVRVWTGPVRAELLQDKQASVEVSMRRIAAEGNNTAIPQTLADTLASLLGRLSAAGCDVLGLARKAIVHAEDIAQWQAFNWPEQMKRLTWKVSVHMQGPT